MTTEVCTKEMYLTAVEFEALQHELRQLGITNGTYDADFHAEFSPFDVTDRIRMDKENQPVGITTTFSKISGVDTIVHILYLVFPDQMKLKGVSEETLVSFLTQAGVPEIKNTTISFVYLKSATSNFGYIKDFKMTQIDNDFKFKLKLYVNGLQAEWNKLHPTIKP